MRHESAERKSLQAALTDFYEEQEYKGNRPATLRYYRTTLSRFVRDAELEYLDEVDTSTIRSWLVTHHSASRATLATYDRCLRVFTRWLTQRGYIESNPMVNLSKPKGRSTPLTVFSEADIRGMLQQARSQRNPLRDEALLILLLDTGLRIGEAAGLSLKSINWQQGWLNVDGKTGARAVPFGRKARRALRLYIERGRKAKSPLEQRLFLGRTGEPLSTESAAAVVTRHARGANVRASKVGPHTFRHTFALEFIRAGGDAFSLQRILGHTTLDMTRKYVHLAADDLREAHARFAPADRLL